MTQWYAAVLGASVASVLLLLCVDAGIRIGRRRRRRTRKCRPMFQVQRNGRIRFELEDLRRSAASANRRLPGSGPFGAVPDLENTLPDLFGGQMVSLPRPHDRADPIAHPSSRRIQPFGR